MYPKIDGTIADGSKNLNLVRLMFNFLEYSSSYFDKTGSLRFYLKDDATNFNADIEGTYNSKSFKDKAKYWETKLLMAKMEF